jgi:hypothetical protein
VDARPFVFSGSQIKEDELPTQDCFDKHRLTFVEDLVHGANRDPRHPKRAYAAPYVLHPMSRDLSGSFLTVPTTYSYKMRLPFELEGDKVLIQWQVLLVVEIRFSTLLFAHLCFLSVIPQLLFKGIT